jgi:hypothetical protein
LAPPLGSPEDKPNDGVEPGHTISTEGSVEGAHAVEFSKTVAPLQEGASFPPGTSGNRLPAPERTDEYSAESGRGTSLRKIFPGRANHVREARKPRSTGADSVAEIGSG